MNTLHSIAVLAVTGLLMAQAAQGCECVTRYSVCGEVAASDLVFIGTVESVEPAFLDPWNADRNAMLHYDEITRLLAEGSTASIGGLRSLYMQMFPNMPEYYQRILKTAHTVDQMREIFSSLSGEGRQARIRVRTLFQHKSDDDDDSKGATAKKDDGDDEDLTGKVIDVWTEASDCGVSFQVGETYLVYADDDEETGTISTSTCTRTARVSDAGADLAYLYYFKNGGARSSRLEGFITSDAKAKFATEALRDVSAIASPVGGTVVQLKSGDPPRYTYSDSAGRFVFDGLPAGEYILTVFAPGYPRTVRELGFPQSLHIASKSCARQILVAPDGGPSPK